MSLGVRADKDCLHELLEGNSPVDMGPKLANNPDMVEHHEADTLNPLGGRNHLHLINSHSK
jgi:hypothetical protein